MELIEQKNKINFGYKQTEFGMIPEEWKLKFLKDICKVNQGLQIAIEKRLKNPTQKSKVYITLQYLNNSKEVEYIDSYTSSVCCDKDDILMTRTGNTGVVVSNVEGVFHNNFFKVKYNKEIINKMFLFYYFNSKKTQNIILAKAGTSTIPDLNHKDFYSIPIPLPNKSEQTAIATILFDIDSLIDSLDKLITKKRNIKQATMQQLLTGKTRLPGFSGNWEPKTFGDIMTGFSSGATPSRNRPDFYKGNIRWITSGELNYNVITDTIEKISIEAISKTNLKLLPKGTFLMAITGLEAEGTRGSCGIVGAEATTNQSCMALFPKKDLSIQYLFHYYVYKGKSLALEYCQGTKQQSYTGKIVKLLPILLPPLEEQQAIATILSDMDAEIVALEQKRDKTRALKQGMMQELLTGKTRLI